MSHTTRHIGVRVPAALAEQLTERAKAEDRSVSAVVRRAIDAHLSGTRDARIRDQGEAHIFEEARR